MSHDKHGPRLPTIVDEAPDTASWVPALGLGLLALFTIFIAIRLAWMEANPVAEAPAPEQAAAAAQDADKAPAP
jgi:hypothetical protein